MWKIYESIVMALRSIQSYKMRALLTMLGITIGVYAITVVFTLVDSMKYSVSKNLAALGNTTLFVHNWPWKDNSEDWYKYFSRPKANYGEFLYLKHRLKNVTGVGFEAVRQGVTLKTRNASAENTVVRGITYDFLDVGGLTIGEGRPFSPIETEAGRNVCIIGYRLAYNLFGVGPYLGQSIRVSGKSVKIVGVLARQGNNLFGGSFDDVFLIPYPLFTRAYNVNLRQIDKIISIKAVDYESTPGVESDIISYMRLKRGLKPGVEDNFSVNKQEALMQQLEKLFYYLNVGGGIISAFSLLIGGFGIANIMFVSVKERTKEIGIQKALGSTRGFILMQFLVEAILLCIIGGGIGLVFLFATCALGQLISNQFELGLEIVISVRDITISVLLSGFIGLISGLAPSFVAAGLNPVDAIRSK